MSHAPRVFDTIAWSEQQTTQGGRTSRHFARPKSRFGSGGWGYTVGLNIGYGYVRRAAGVDDAYLASGTYELEVATRRVSATLQLAPLYDPAMARIKS